MNKITYKGYLGRYAYDPEAGVFHGEVAHISDVITFQGQSIAEMQGALADSVETYLDLCKQTGKAPDSPDGVQIEPARQEETLEAAF